MPSAFGISGCRRRYSLRMSTGERACSCIRTCRRRRPPTSGRRPVPPEPVVRVRPPPAHRCGLHQLESAAPVRRSVATSGTRRPLSQHVDDSLAASPSQNGGTAASRCRDLLDPARHLDERSGRSPSSVLVPIDTVTGRSVLSRSVRHGTPRKVVSSWMPPESVSTPAASRRAGSGTRGSRAARARAGPASSASRPMRLHRAAACAGAPGRRPAARARARRERVERVAPAAARRRAPAGAASRARTRPRSARARRPRPIASIRGAHRHERVDHRVADVVDRVARARPRAAGSRAPRASG